MDKLDLRHVWCGAALGRPHEHNPDVSRLAWHFTSGRQAFRLRASEPVECDRSVIGHEARFVVGIVGEDFPLGALDDLGGL